MSRLASGKTVLVAPLDWGLGHATRSIPIINYLLDRGHEVILGSSGASRLLLQQEFPALKMAELPAYNVQYGRGKSLVMSIARQIPKILSAIDAEHRTLQKLVKQFDIDVVISDNRYGLWHEGVTTAIMTHQLFIKAPVLAGQINRLNAKYISRFDYCLVPDYEGDENLSGELSHDGLLPKKTHYLGPLTRFADIKASQKIECYDIVCLVSGPEPQRSQFESMLIEKLRTREERVLLLCGKPHETIDYFARPGLRVISHLDTAELAQVLKASKSVIARAGYSTVMDLAEIDKPALLIPTPGQPEQEYLAKHLSDLNCIASCNQEELTTFDLDQFMNSLSQFSPFPKGKQNSLSILDTIVSQAEHLLLY